MNKFGVAFFTFLFFTLSFCLVFRPQPPEPVSEPVWSNSRHYPYENFFMQMAYPDALPNIREKEAALNQIKRDKVFRSAPEGFSEPWVTQGPGNIGARINTVAVHPGDESIMYAGFSAGGVFKTTDEGASWQPIFDEQNFLAIGDIALDPNNPEVVYVGTGDPNISGFPFIGDGLYRSRNAGMSWEHLGLKDQRILSKVIVDPSNSNIIYVAAMGIPFERNRDRGVYKSIDGGQSWEQILFISEQTGIIDLLINPANPQILYAAGWDRIRNNKESNVRGDGARIFNTRDGGGKLGNVGRRIT